MTIDHFYIEFMVMATFDNKSVKAHSSRIKHKKKSFLQKIIPETKILFNLKKNKSVRFERKKERMKE